MFFLYIIYSESLNKYYTGYSKNVTVRLNQHNEGISGFTSFAKDWVLKYKEEFKTREEAKNRELEIKKKKSRKYIEYIISTCIVP